MTRRICLDLPAKRPAIGIYPNQQDPDSTLHCGWPSFDDALPGAIRYIEDSSHGMVRTEVRCANCDSRLGHLVAGEGYTPKNQQYCINSIALTLEPAAD